VCIDGVDQATQLTGFVWDGAFSGHLKRASEASNSLLLEASHDGYSRLDVPVCHIRSILHDPDGSWVIKDRFQGSGRHNFELNFHFHPEVSLTELGSGWMAERNGLRLQIELLHGRFLLRRGEEEPPLGWFSPAYNVRLPSPVLQVNRFGASEEMVFETRITVK
jgi:hypothetical protein